MNYIKICIDAYFYIVKKCICAYFRFFMLNCKGFGKGFIALTFILATSCPLQAVVFITMFKGATQVSLDRYVPMHHLPSRRLAHLISLHVNKPSHHDQNDSDGHIQYRHKLPCGKEMSVPPDKSILIQHCDRIHIHRG